MKNKERKPRKDFSQRLAKKLSSLGEVEEGNMGDNSCRWVVVKVGKLSISFSFDMKGENIDSIGLYEDVWQKVDERKIMSFDKKEK